MEGSLGAGFLAASLCVLCDSWPLLPFCSYLVGMGYACAPGRHFACTLLFCARQLPWPVHPLVAVVDLFNAHHVLLVYIM